MEGELMQGKSDSILRLLGAGLFTVAVVMLSPPVSHARQPENHQHEHEHHGHHQQQLAHYSVPEPDASVLLLIGLGVTGLVSYGMQRRKRGT